MNLFKKGFKSNRLTNTDQVYDSDTIILIDAYQQLKNLGLIEQDAMIALMRGPDRSNVKHTDEFPCELIPTIVGTHVLNLLFHNDDFTEIPSLKQDIKDLEDVIIDPKVAKELEEKYNRTA